MNIDTILQNIQTQGPIFWTASLAMALGATLLVVSMISQARRILGAGRNWPNPLVLGKLKFQKKPSQNARSSKTQVTISKTEGGYQPSSISPLNPGPSQNTQLKDESRELASRLHMAANALEEIRQGLKQDNFSPGFSALKHPTEDVEYLFKTTTV